MSERLASEGFNWRIISGFGTVGIDATIINSTGSPISLNSVGQLNIPPGRMMTGLKFAISSTTVTGTANQVLQVQVNEDAVGPSPASYGKITYGRYQLIDNTPSQIIDLSQYVLHGNSVVTLSLFNHAANTTTHVFGQVIAGDMTDDMNYTADKQQLFVGDSITYNAAVGNFQSYTFADTWVYKTRQYYIDKGIDTRLVNISTHGINTSQIETQRIQGKFNSRKYDQIIYMAGTNDSSASFSGPQITAAVALINTNYANFINWKKISQPQAKLIMVTPPPIQDATREAQLVQFRSAMQAQVLANGDSKTFFCSNASAWTATDSTKYNGDGVHPNISAQPLLFAALKTTLDASAPTI